MQDTQSHGIQNRQTDRARRENTDVNTHEANEGQVRPIRASHHQGGKARETQEVTQTTQERTLQNKTGYSN